MLWFKSETGLCRAVAVLVVAVILGGPSACGFRPLYGQHADRSVSDDLAAVKIAPVGDRLGQHLHNFLLDRLNPKGSPAEPKFVLQITLTESLATLAFRKDATATRANLLVSVVYELRDTQTGKRVFRTQSTVTTSYNIVESDFATLSAKADARRRAARNLSDEIRTRLAIYFNRQRRV